MSGENSMEASGSEALEKKKPRRHGQIYDIWRRLCRNRLAVFGMAILVLLVLMAVFADVIAPYPYDKQDYAATLQFPSLAHPMGTDNYGRDILSRIIYGSRVSLRIGFISLSCGAVVGCILGAVAGFFGKAVDTVIMRLMDIMTVSYTHLDVYKRQVEGALSKSPDLLRVNRLQLVSAHLKDLTGSLQLTWYNMPYMRTNLKTGQIYIFRGRVVKKRGRLIMEQPEVFTPEAYEVM